MTPAETEYFDALLTLFATEGWKFFVADHEEAALYLEKLNSTVDDEMEWRRNQGAYQVHQRIISFEQITRERIDALENQGIEDDTL